MAQSMGGGGGDSGSVHSLFALGGQSIPGQGGSGSSVSIRSGPTGRIDTRGDESDALYAQSIGGSGGSATDAFGVVGLGGNGAVAGHGGAVTIENYGDIVTMQAGSMGIFAQSIGGAGGDGGNARGMVSVGGRGGAGGSSGLVQVINGGNITTGGANSGAVFAQSVGGGGGNGGSSGGVAQFFGFSIGGDGGGGGHGGDVNVTLQGGAPFAPSTISTTGHKSKGIFAQSVGGGGGTGGGSVLVNAGAVGAATISLGGSGGLAARGGAVTLAAGEGRSNIATQGEFSEGVELQSVGGTGGDGGLSVALTASVGPVAGSISVAQGGRGGFGGDAGAVRAGVFDELGNMITAGFNGRILTDGEFSTGFLAHAVGGGGGNGGLAVSAAGAVGSGFAGALAIGLGGEGGGAGHGGTVQVGIDGDITTLQDKSIGVLAQSVGGGGGNGGAAIAAAFTGTVGYGLSVQLAMGGSGGEGGNGGNVTLATRSSLVQTSGEHSAGIIAQSTGGGGGTGGYTVAAGGGIAFVGTGGLSIGIGGSGGSGGRGGVVIAHLESDVVTRGDTSAGVIAQSTGGAGGVGGYNVSVVGAGAVGVGVSVGIGLGGSGGGGGNGGQVTATSSGFIATDGFKSNGFTAQSIGGGGGTGGYNVTVGVAGAAIGSGALTVGLGGSGGTASHGGVVLAQSSGGLIRTLGENSVGVLAQSVGGGGGDGGYNVVITGTGAGVGSAGVAVGLGGSGGGGGNGAAVALSVSNDVDTTGNNSGGVLAQSLGKGGGNGGFNVSVAGSFVGIGGAVAVGLGGSGAGGGHGGAVVATSTGSIHTRGDKSNAFTAQSIGGGGGTGGFNVSVGASVGAIGNGAASVGLGGSGAVAGNGGLVHATVLGDIWTEGKNSIGVLAQSVGGAGGDGGFNVDVAGAYGGTGGGALSVGLGGTAGGGGAGSAVTLFVGSEVASSDVLIRGAESMGIVAQSIGGGGGNGGFNVSATLAGGGVGAGAVGVGIGGSGGAGGNAGAVNSTLFANIVNARELLLLATAESVDHETASGGVLAQSVGGGGGSGSFNLTGVLSLGSTGAGAAAVGIGGMGGDGGSSSRVTNNFTGTIENSRDGGFGVIAQSLGGGGGVGGVNFTGAVTAGSSGSGALAFGLGGFGGGGGNGNEVHNTVNTLDGIVLTRGDNAVGVLAQSIGGAGGKGGLNITGLVTASSASSGGVGIGVGGFGGGGGHGSLVVNRVTGGVVTTGSTNSKAILAQSVGGAGGDGGVNITGTVNIGKASGGTLGLGVGGFGGGGGNGGRVESTVRTTDATQYFRTSGNASTAITAQSIGGAGGVGALNYTGAVSLSGGTNVALGVGVGGFGGGSGNADAVTLAVVGDVQTLGNTSHGLFAQSLGGSGGDGGINITGSLALSTTSGQSSAISVGIGGFGGGGGSAGSVTLAYQGTLIAAGLLADESAVGAGGHGIFAQSAGGGGGSGGINVSAGVNILSNAGTAVGAVFGLGGFGGGGGNAGAVGVTVTGESITAYGQGKSAIFAQSEGGGGGEGGINVTAGLTSNASLLFGFGGFGGDAGIGRDVAVNATTDVNAFQREATPVGPGDTESVYSAAGVFAQSVGGGGGNGGINVTGGITFSDPANSLTFGLGGFGGAGAASGAVSVTLDGDANTTGRWVHGILAQSIAGGGGNGGLNVSGQVTLAGGTDLAVIAGVGGNGGTGDNAGVVQVSHTGSVTTIGDNARGIVAQSVGGGGGMGGMNVTGLLSYGASPITLGVGGSGEAGGNAGSVLVVRGSAEATTGRISTTGANAYGIEASSIGGGGGDAGMNFVVGAALGVKDTSYVGSIAVGGGGGQSGSAGIATVRNYSDIETNLAGSHGILAQSIGAGGGNGNYNMAVTGSYAPDAENGYTGSLLVGGQPGDGGVAAAVVVTQVGNVETSGVNSFGILAQSIGGGGGNVGLDFNKAVNAGVKNKTTLTMTLGKVGGTGGASGSVTLSSTGSIRTHANGSFGLLAQSIGAGGGTSSTTSVSLAQDTTSDGKKTSIEGNVAVGRTGGIGGGAGNVTVNAIGEVRTTGQAAHAIFAQSVGGGGGSGGGKIAANFLTNAPSVGISVGGNGGEGGVGGDVTVTSFADLRTATDNSIGILAQSVGGGGGTGGYSVTGGAGYGKGTLSVGVGGDGGSGNTSGVVGITSGGIVDTDGDFSHGILAQSIGGGGGNGGMTINFLIPIPIPVTAPTVTPGATVFAVQVGGSGGDGATSGSVSVINTGAVVTRKSNSIGVLAQSIGGGGGNAGNVYSGMITRTTDTNIFSFAVGGDGGEGGVGESVVVRNESRDSLIVTSGDSSHGIYAMSIGGGGGIGSNVITADLSYEPSSDTAVQSGITFGLGGSGGVGGRSGIVDVLNQGTITTSGSQAHGIIAQSIGGGGGSGGYAISGNIQLGGSAFGDEPPPLVIAVGGAGGSGNTAAPVTVTNTGNIEVWGNSSYGVYAQSVGGGGGDGNFAVTATPNVLSLNPSNLLANVGLGGVGGDGGAGGNVTVNNAVGSLQSHGDDSIGVFAQSVGGGGGKMGWAVGSPAWSLANLLIQQTIGGGTLGRAGDVTVTGQGNIVMSGDRSNAVFTQSVAGGGGNVDLLLDASKQAVRIGQDGIIIPTNPAIAGWLILVGLGADVEPSDISAVAAAADPLTDVSGGTVMNQFQGSVATTGNGSTASEVQSIGGGGGTANEVILVDTLAEGDFNLEVGGSNVNNGDGGDITDSRHGDVATLGSDSMGALVQSIGGGGGSALIEVTTILLPEHTGGFSVAQSTLGGNATIDSDGGAINAVYVGGVSTAGDRSPGLLLQSIGAGGGQATMTGFDSLDVVVGGQNGAAGNGAPILVNNGSSVATTGEFSHGIILQSVGGGGGALWSDATAPTVTASADNTGDGESITLYQTGDITTQGAGAIGILAQSLGGGGGFVNREFMDTAGGVGSSGSVNIGVQGNIAARGEDGIGIFAQSRGSTGQGNIGVSLAWENQIVVGDSGVGVVLSGGTDNYFLNEGIVYADSTAASPDGFSVMATEGNDSVSNWGTLYGSLDLGAGNNSVVNQVGANMYAGATLFVGESADEVFENHGRLALGDTSTYTTQLNGSYVQGPTGQMDITVDGIDDSIDLLHVSRTATVEGTMNLLFKDSGYFKPGERELIFLLADEGVSYDGLTLVAPESAVAQFSLGSALPLEAAPEGALFAVAPPNFIPLNMVVNFAGVGGGTFNRNQTSTGEYINEIQLAGGSPDLAPMIAALIALPTASDVASAYDSMSPEVYTSAQRSLDLSSNRFLQSMLGCSQLDSAYKFNDDGDWVASNRTSYLTDDDGSGAGTAAAMQKGHFVWFDSVGGFYNSDPTSEYFGFRSTSFDVAAGVQFDLGDQWFAGVGLGFATISTNLTDGATAQSDGSVGEIGASITKFFGSTKLALAVGGGYSEFDVTRSNIFGSPTPATGEFNASYYAARFRASHDFKFTDWYVRPFVDAAFSGINSQSFNETGAGAMDLMVSSATYNVFSVSPTLQFGHEFKAGSCTISPYGSVGYSWYSSAAPSISAALEGAPIGVPTFNVSGLNDQNFINAAGGVDLKLSNSILIQAIYAGQFSQNTSSSNVQLKVVIPF